MKGCSFVETTFTTWLVYASCRSIVIFVSIKLNLTAITFALNGYGVDSLREDQSHTAVGDEQRDPSCLGD